MTKTYTIKSFNDIIKVGTTFGKNWFRGHSKVFENLTPGIFRDKYNSPMHEMFKPNQEFDLITSFKRYAPAVEANLPGPDEHLEWIFWMQHFGIPTRLLDWTESILVALFFAVVNHPEDDAEIWTIYPDYLNVSTRFYGLSLHNDRSVQFLAAEPLHNNPEKLAKELGLDEVPQKPIAFIPQMIFQRIKAQSGTFTIHPKPTEGNTIQDVITDTKNITRYIIPTKLKPDFEKKLSYLEINYRTLFPDLEGLSKSFAREERYFGWGQPEPPKF